MIRNLLVGAVAGATATVALDVSTYADMAWRGRAPSEMTRKVIEQGAARAGVEALSPPNPDETTKNRQTALGSLAGYATGVGAGVVYGAVRPLVRGFVPYPIAGVILGFAVMAFTDSTAVALEATDVREWDAASWLSDAIPHVIYGLVAAATFEKLAA